MAKQERKKQKKTIFELKAANSNSPKSTKGMATNKKDKKTAFSKYC
jgi:hypothetical protein